MIPLTAKTQRAQRKNFNKTKLSDFVAATLRLRTLCGPTKLSLALSNDEKRRIKPAATMTCNIKSRNLENNNFAYFAPSCPGSGDILQYIEQ